MKTNKENKIIKRSTSAKKSGQKTGKRVLTAEGLRRRLLQGKAS